MRARTALCFATVALFLTAGWNGECFAGSGLAGAPKDERAAVAVAARNEPAAEVIVQSTDSVDVPVDASGVDNAGNARTEEAGPAPTEKRPGQAEFLARGNWSEDFDIGRGNRDGGATGR